MVDEELSRRSTKTSGFSLGKVILLEREEMYSCIHMMVMPLRTSWCQVLPSVIGMEKHWSDIDLMVCQ